MTTTLTPRQSQALTFIRQSVATWGYPPTRREIAAKLKVCRHTVEHHLKTLERKGRLRVVPGKARGIKLIAWPRPPRACPVLGHPAHLPALARPL